MGNDIRTRRILTFLWVIFNLSVTYFFLSLLLFSVYLLLYVYLAFTLYLPLLMSLHTAERSLFRLPETLGFISTHIILMLIGFNSSLAVILKSLP